MDHNDDILVLLQDIKEITWGILLFLVGCVLCRISAAIGSGWSAMLLLVGFVICIAGLAYGHHGFTHHKVVEKKD